MTGGGTSFGGQLPAQGDGASPIEDTQPRLRVFISSPSDVRPERLIAERVVRRLDREFSASVRVQPVMWEREPLLATHHFQTTITKPHDTDIVVVILWSSLGTPLPTDEFPGPLSAGQVTGTAWEFEDAVEAYRACGRPKVLMYRKRTKVVEALDDRAAVQRRTEQMDQVDAFFQRWFVDKTGLLPSNASREFDSAAAFEDMLESHLRGLIEAHAHSAGGASAGLKRTWHDNPFRGLLSFELKDSAVFFGRTRARNDLRELIARRAQGGSAFVLVFGASGSGKSSLVKAGLLADLVLPGMIGRVALVRHAALRPSDRRGALLEALAAAIIEPKEALPELSAPPLNDTVASLAKLLREAPGQAARPIRQGLSAAGQAAGLETSAEARLVLMIDQLEELFTLDEAAAAERELFVAALAALAESGLVWVIATMRSDFFDRLELLPSLAMLSEGEARFLLLPPGAAEIGQIIRQPAREAGLRYEIDPSSKVGLDEIIRQDAVHSNDVAPSAATPNGQDAKAETHQAVPHGALPLLSFVLDQLWRRRTDDGVLTFAAYRELGGLKGAIGRRAEEVYLAQPQEVQNELVPVLRELVTVTGGIATARSAPLAAFPRGTPGRALVDALLDKDARLLVADGSSAGALVRLAHEALLTHWPRAHDQVASDARDLELRGRLEQEAARWRAAAARDKKSLVRPSGLPLAEALALQERWGTRLPAVVSEFVRASRRAALHRRLRLGGVVAAAAASLPLIAAVVWAAWVWSGVRAVEAEMTFVTIPAGCFDMGSPLDDEERGRNEGVDGVAPGFCLTSFELGAYEVTQDEWRRVMLHVSTPSSFSGPRNPVESVSWNEAKTFAWLMSLFGKHHYRLASEAQWEYAARGRTTPTPYMRRYWGDRAEDGCAYENTSDLKLHERYRDYPYSKCEDGYVNTAPVGSFKPNPFGIYDMLGNVGEWVEDCYVQDLRQLPKDGSPAEQANCPRRVIRGGSWGESAFRMRAANRVVVEGGHRDNFYGFRVVRAP